MSSQLVDLSDIDIYSWSFFFLKENRNLCMFVITVSGTPAQIERRESDHKKPPRLRKILITFILPSVYKHQYKFHNNIELW